jgi:hypothetical protein
MIRDRPEPSWLHTVNKYEQLMALKNFETYYLLVFERKKQKKRKALLKYEQLRLLS